jgi:hypothetical protein
MFAAACPASFRHCRCGVLPRPEEILVLHLHDQRRGRRPPAGQQVRSAGPGSLTRSTGSIERTGSEVIGRRRSCPSATRFRLAATSISRRPPMQLVRRARRRNVFLLLYPLTTPPADSAGLRCFAPLSLTDSAVSGMAITGTVPEPGNHRALALHQIAALTSA